jgi:signal transduction histidine kinase
VVLDHDLRNPLGAISGCAELLIRRPLNEKADRLVAVIRRQGVARIAGLIDDVMDFARGQLGPRNIWGESRPVDPAPFGDGDAEGQVSVTDSAGSRNRPRCGRAWRESKNLAAVTTVAPAQV